MRKVLIFIAAAALVLSVSAAFAGKWVNIGLPDSEHGSSRNADQPNKYKLLKMVHDAGIIDEDPQYTLAPWQAAKVLKVMKPFTTQEKMTEDEAKEALRRMKYIFTPEQLKAMENPVRRNRDGNKPPAAENEKPKVEVIGDTRDYEKKMKEAEKKDPSKAKDFNPFYLKDKPVNDHRASQIKNLKKFFAAMEEKAAKAK